MLNFGWAELMVIGVVALIVIGPDDLPDMFRQMGRFTAKLRSMSREFSRAMDQAAKESGVKDVAKDLKNVTSPKALGLDAVKSAADKFEKWDPIKNAAKPIVTQAKPLVPAPMPATAARMPATSAPEVVVDDSAEAADDLAEHAAPVHGPATQALYDKQAARAVVFAEQSAKLKAIDAGTYQETPSILPPAVPLKKPRVTKPKPVETVTSVETVAPVETVAKSAPKPRKITQKAETP